MTNREVAVVALGRLLVVERYRETLARADLADRNWTVTIPASATDALEQAGYL